MSQDFYQVLGVDRNSSTEEIKRAYRRLAKEYHPDLNKSPGAEAQFKKINEAYEVLSDPQKKANYDRFGSGFDGSGGYSSGFDSSGGSDPISDIFNKFFARDEEDSFFSSSFQSPSSGGSRRRGGEKISRKDVRLSFLQAVTGCDYELSYKSNQVCKECNGNKSYMGDKSYIYDCSICRGHGYEIVRNKSVFGIVESKIHCRYCGGTGEKITKECNACKKQGFTSETKRVTIKIPGGLKNGDVVTFVDSSSYDEKKIYLNLHIENSHVFTRKGDELHTRVFVNPLLVILGGSVEVPTPYGLKSIRIPAGFNTSSLLRVKNMGINFPKKGIKDLFVKVEVAALRFGRTDLEKIKSIALSEPREASDLMRQFKREYGESKKS